METEPYSERLEPGLDLEKLVDAVRGRAFVEVYYRFHHDPSFARQAAEEERRSDPDAGPEPKPSPR